MEDYLLVLGKLKEDSRLSKSTKKFVYSLDLHLLRHGSLTVKQKVSVHKILKDLGETLASYNK